jgi:hypothetical protein
MTLLAAHSESPQLRHGERSPAPPPSRGRHGRRPGHCSLLARIRFTSNSECCPGQVTHIYSSLSQTTFGGSSACVATEDVSSYIGQTGIWSLLVSYMMGPGPLVQCLINCNVDSSCGGFWVKEPVSTTTTSTTTATTTTTPTTTTTTTTPGGPYTCRFYLNYSSNT